MKTADISRVISDKGLKVTPQRLAILEALFKLNNHPTADYIVEHIHKSHPHISVGTVYKVLETFVEKGIIHKVNTEKDIMRYDANIETHHHLFFSDSDRIEDFHDEGLTEIILKHFEKKSIPGFRIEDIRLHIVGKKTSTKNNNHK